MDNQSWKNRLDSQVQLIPANQLLANPKNPRVHPARQREALRGSLETLGFVAPVLVSKRTQFMLDGHARVEEALTKDENTLIPVIEVDLEAHEESLFLASFDYITYLAEYDRDSLDALLQDVQTDDNRLQAMLGELAQSNGLDFGDTPEIVESPEAQIDRAEELNKVWNVKTGDLWIIPSKSGSGVHRLLCGDSTKAEDVMRLMGNERADMMFTDPPYNVDYDGQGSLQQSLVRAGYRDATSLRPIENDSMNREDWLQFCEAWMQSLLKALGGVCYICMSQKEWATVRFIFEKCGGHWSSDIIWVKDSLVLGRKDYHSRYEAILYGWPSSISHQWYGDRTQTDIWEIVRPKNSDLHPTMKPVELVQKAINNSTLLSAVVYDPFGGSGTTMVACEQLSRQCRMIEIEPKYCAVILQRMKDMGLSPYLEEPNGKTD